MYSGLSFLGLISCLYLVACPTLLPFRVFSSSTSLPSLPANRCVIAPSTIPGGGRGGFNSSGSTVRKGTAICNYYGFLMTEQEVVVLQRMYGRRLVTMVEAPMFGFQTVMIGFVDSPGSCINHKPEPYANCQLVLDRSKCGTQGFKDLFLAVYACNDVKNGQEYFLDYGKHAHAFFEL